MEKTLKAPNYTVEQTATLLNDYAAGFTPEAIALKVGKTVRSVIAKLSREKVYVAKTYATKSGEAVVKKDAVADAISLAVGLTEAETTSLVGANKTALKKILAMLSVVAVTATEVGPVLTD